MRSPSPRVHRFGLRVYAADTDASGIVHHSQYLVFAERARTEMLRDFDIAAETLGDVGIGYWVVAKAGIAFRQPARLDDWLTVASHVEGVRAASCQVRQRVLRGETLLVDIGVEVAWLGPDGRPRRQPWRARMEELAAAGDAA
jgi:acyl-CoA thioester hydrolase